MEPVVQLGEETRVTQEHPGSAREVDTHRRPGRALEDEIGARGAQHLGRGVAVLADVPHDRDLTSGDVAPAVTTQDGTRIERVHIRVTTARERV